MPVANGMPSAAIGSREEVPPCCVTVVSACACCQVAASARLSGKLQIAVAGAGELAGGDARTVSPTQLPKKGGSASRRDASSSSANLIARLRGRVFLFVFLVGEGKKPVSQWRGASLSQKLRRLSKWFPGLS